MAKNNRAYWSNFSFKAKKYFNVLLPLLPKILHLIKPLKERKPIEKYIFGAYGHLPPLFSQLCQTEDFVDFFQRCQSGLSPDGLICVKENITKSGVDLDSEDSSVTRYKHWKS